MPNVSVVGVQWGDEGKGKVIDFLASEARWVVRYQGGANAGHTVVLGDDVFVLHLLPSGVLRPGVKSVIGNGVVVDPKALLDEVEALERRGIEVKDLFVSERAHVVMPYHRILDALKESGAAAFEQKIGTTKRGIGPTYADKAARTGIRVVDLLDWPLAAERIKRNMARLAQLYRDQFEAESHLERDILEAYRGYAEQLRPYVADTAELVNAALDRDERILFEGAQGSLLDVDFGTYPYVTSSNASVLGIPAGVGISPRRLGRILGVVKAYTTRVGEGPFPSELSGEVGERLREVGREYGATTGRPRRCGWFDAVAARHAVRTGGIDSLVLTKLDVLSGLDEVKVAVAYRALGREFRTFPAGLRELEAAEPVYETLPGFCVVPEELSGYHDLPQAARDYVEFLEARLGAPVEYVSVGRRRTEILVRGKGVW